MQDFKEWSLFANSSSEKFQNTHAESKPVTSCNFRKRNSITGILEMLQNFLKRFSVKNTINVSLNVTMHSYNSREPTSRTELIYKTIFHKK